ncbi:MAG TPA: hypothetical protein VN806_02480, partial [Caulobacteraceae bacterium]|nr:hypothetical protein [Caulobacteraceae bacterium]
MTEPPAAAEGFLPAPIALARGLASARPPALSARRLPGLPTLALARPARARNIAMTLSAPPWGARWALGVLWGADGAPGPQGPPGRPGA